MKFTVRKGFVINHVEMKKIGDEMQELRNTYAGGESVDLEEATALAHLHKLEPADKAAKEFVQARHVPTPPPVGSADAAAIGAAVTAALAAAGIGQAQKSAQA